MIRALLAAALAVVALPVEVQAQAQESPLDGVWQGTVGDLPIHACFSGQGIYYYDRVMELIRLEPDEQGFAERVGWSEEGSARWQVAPVSASRAEGLWRDGARSLPIRLARLEWEQPDDEVVRTPCETQAFMGPRLVGGAVLEQGAGLGGAPYTVLEYQPPAHFAAHGPDDYPSVEIATFAIPEREHGDRAINAVLAAYLPRGEVADAFADCLIANAAWRGMDGHFAQIVQPEAIDGRYLGLIESNDTYCGGAHPNHWQHRRVFDRHSGVEVDPVTWLNERALTREVVGEADYASVSTALSDPFRAFVVEHWPVDAVSDPECAGVALEAYGWDMGLAPDGVAFLPELPHVIQACAETVTVSWSDLAPWLSLEGQAAALASGSAP